eukprot:11398507-Alexandrium_andersonii.AAC.1
MERLGSCTGVCVKEGCHERKGDVRVITSLENRPWETTGLVIFLSAPQPLPAGALISPRRFDAGYHPRHIKTARDNTPLFGGVRPLSLG